MRNPTWIGATLMLAVLAAACGYNPADDPASATAADVPTTSAPPPTTTSTTLPPGGRQPTPDDPLRVVFAGDSVMAELAPAASDALNRGGSADARFVLSPGVVLDEVGRVLWGRQLDTFDPDVVVVLVGTWETAGEFGRPGEPGWRERYDREVLDPFVQLVTSRGAEVVWVGMAAVADSASTYLLADLNAAYADLPARHDRVTYLPGGEFLSAPTGGFAEFVDTANGPVRLRRTDGLHLCPEGVARLAEPVLDTLVQHWNVPIAADWRTGAWRRPPLLVKPEECPQP